MDIDLEAFARELIQEHSSPPLCRVCGEALSCGSAGRDGIKWAHYDAPRDRSLLYDKENMDHIDKSVRWDPMPDERLVALARGFLELKRQINDRNGPG
jgi:hypothetical protein